MSWCRTLLQVQLHVSASLMRSFPKSAQISLSVTSPVMVTVAHTVTRKVCNGVIVVDAQFLRLVDQVFFAAYESESTSDTPVAFPKKCTATTT
ncbi:hypothetical protein D3C71_1904540 [compost metagenome]